MLQSAGCKVQKLVSYCRTTSASTAPCTSRRMCCPTHCARYCAPCQPLVRAFAGWIRSPPPDCLSRGCLPVCFRAKMRQSLRFSLFSPERKGQHLALTVLCVPCSLARGVLDHACRKIERNGFDRNPTGRVRACQGALASSTASRGGPIPRFCPEAGLSPSSVPRRAYPPFLSRGGPLQRCVPGGAGITHVQGSREMMTIHTRACP